MKPTKKQILIGAGWVVFQILFWFLGKPHTMGPVTAFFGVNLVTALYAAGVWVALTKILQKKKEI